MLRALPLVVVVGCLPRGVDPPLAPPYVVQPRTYAAHAHAECDPPPDDPDVAEPLAVPAPAPPTSAAERTLPVAPVPAPAERHSYHQALPPFRASAPAMRFANLTEGNCRKELRKRKLPVSVPRRGARGIANPVRVVAAIGGVKFLTAPAPSPVGLLDCRLALSLGPLAEVLAQHDVSEVHIGSMYRKGAQIAGRNRRSQHSYGLAMDVVALRLSDRTLLSVERDWHASIGERACGPGAVLREPNKKAIALRNILCAVARAQVFHHMLTPSANRAHHDHFHFDIKRDAAYQSLK